MKIFVWRKGFFTQYSDGLAVVIAENAQQAKEQLTKQILKAHDWYEPSDYGICESMDEFDKKMGLDKAPEEFEIGEMVFFVAGGS